MDDILRDLVGKQIQVYSAWGDGEKSDTGVLEAYDSQWLLIRRNGEALYFCISRVRLIKPLS